MKLADIIVIAVIVLIIGAALMYIIKAKKSGKKCIGCPYGDACSSKKASGEGSCSCSCGCTNTSQNK
jgi:hypothetical protein